MDDNNSRIYLLNHKGYVMFENVTILKLSGIVLKICDFTTIIIVIIVISWKAVYVTKAPLCYLQVPKLQPPKYHMRLFVYYNHII